MNEEMNLTHLGLDAINSPMGMPIWKASPGEKVESEAVGHRQASAFWGYGSSCVRGGIRDEC